MKSLIPQILDQVRAITPQAIAWRRDIHARPELSNMEFRTSAMAASHLRALGFDEVHEGLAGGTGVIGVIQGSRAGPTVGLRMDLDAQAVKEDTGLPFASQAVSRWGEETVPVMHCCGHDVHTAIGLAAASVVAHLRERLQGRVLFCFQPAEEGPSPGWTGLHGAQALMEEAVFQAYRPDAMFTLHIDPNQPIGTAGELARGAHRRPAAQGQQAPLQTVAAQVEAVPGEEQEGPADALLPEVGGKGAVPGPVIAEEVHQVPAAVIGRHAEQGESPEGIQAVAAGCVHGAVSSSVDSMVSYHRMARFTRRQWVWGVARRGFDHRSTP